jgi:5-methylcytosine-specific restriction endonuclease McrA
MDQANIIESAFRSLVAQSAAAAEVIIDGHWPFVAQQISKRSSSKAQCLEVFKRDGFIDRYNGQRLVFPGVLRIMSNALPAAFPYQKNWKMTETHPAYWMLCPTIDHLIPIARGGADTIDNCVTTSMIHNSAKANWTVEELGWSLREYGNLKEWDGLLGLFLGAVDEKPELVQDPYIRSWYVASK